MAPSFAAAVAEARSYLAALDDHAANSEASAGYERLLLQIGHLHGEPAPPPVAVPSFSRDLLFDLTTAAIEELADHGIDLLTIEFLLDTFELAWVSDVP